MAFVAVACSDDGDSNGDAAARNTLEPTATTALEGETPRAGELVDTAEPGPGPTLEPTPPAAPEAMSEPISPAGPTDEPPATTASFDGAEVEMGIGTYCWSNVCVEKIGPVTRGALTIAGGDEIVVAVPLGAALNSVNAIAFPAGDSVALANGELARQPDFDAFTSLNSERDGDEIRIAVGLAPGTYVVMVGMFFETGNVQYGVVLEVQ